MKTIILSLLILIMSSAVFAQADRIATTDSLKSGRTSINFTVNSRHNYNTLTFKNLASLDSIKVYHLNESGDTTAVSLRNLNSYTDLESNLITGLSGNYEFLILHPNLYKVIIKWVRTASLSKTIDIRRRGNNLK